jgi:flagellin
MDAANTDIRQGEATMSTRINTNVEAFGAQRNLAMTGVSYAKSVEKLSSGLRINRSGDDAAGLSMSEKMRAQIKGLGQAQRNAQDGISMIQTGEGALNETHSMLQRMRELMVQAANDTLGAADRTAITAELGQLGTEIDGTATRTKFNGLSLLNGSLSTSQSGGTANVGTVVVAGTNTSISAVDVTGAAASKTFTMTNAAGVITLSDGTNSQAVTVAAAGAAGTSVLNFSQLGVKITVASVTGDTGANIAAGLTTKTVITAAGTASANFQVGSDASQTIAVAFSAQDAATIGIGVAGAGAVTAGATSAAATAYLTTLDTAIQAVSNQRGVLGAAQNRLEHTIANLGVAQQNMTASESRIRDVDMAAEMVNFTKTGILQQAGQAILAQANSAPQGILSLLR